MVHIPADIWEARILQTVEMNVYSLQRLRAVNRGFREVIDARVLALVRSVQEHPFHSKPPDVVAVISDEETNNVYEAHQSSANWVLLGCIADKRDRLKISGEVYSVFSPTVCDVLGKSFMYFWTATMFGKLSLTTSHPVSFSRLARKMFSSNSHQSKPSHKQKALPEAAYYKERDSWITLTAEKLCKTLPRHMNVERCKRQITDILKTAVYTRVN